MAGCPVSVILLTVTPGPSNFCTNACALLDDIMFNCAFDSGCKEIQIKQNKNILQVSFTCPKLPFYPLIYTTGHKKSPILWGFMAYI
jgi:hypothetical protein